MSDIAASPFVRDALVQALGLSEPMGSDRHAPALSLPMEGRVRLSLRMSREEALATRAAARKAGLSPGALIAGLVDDVPALSGGASRTDHLAALKAAPSELVFRSTTGTMLDPDNLATRVLAPACEAAGVPWAGFHTFRHTVASRLFAEGRNAVQVQRWLGHHSASFTLDTYVHLLDNDLGEPLA